MIRQWETQAGTLRKRSPKECTTTPKDPTVPALKKERSKRYQQTRLEMPWRSGRAILLDCDPGTISWQGAFPVVNPPRWPGPPPRARSKRFALRHRPLVDQTESTVERLSGTLPKSSPSGRSSLVGKSQGIEKLFPIHLKIANELLRFRRNNKVQKCLG